MKFYVAGFGHRFELTDFFNKVDHVLLSYHYIIDGNCQKMRFTKIKELKEFNNGNDQSEKVNKRTRKRKKRNIE